MNDSETDLLKQRISLKKSKETVEDYITIGADVLSDIKKQRINLEKTNERFGKIKQAIIKSKEIINSIQQRICGDKYVFWTGVVIIIFFIFFLIKITN